LHEVTAPRRDEWLEKADGDLADEGLELRHSPWREDTAHELPEPIVLRRIGEGGHRRQLQGLRVEALEEDALHGAVGRPVDEGGHDVGEAGQGPEVEVVVAVERGVVPEPAVDRVGVVVEIVREGVQLHGSALSHGSRCGGNPDGLRKETFGAIDVGTQPGACSSTPSLRMLAPLQPTRRISGDVRRPPARFLPSSGASATVAGGYGLATDLPQLTQARQGEPLVPYKSFPQPAQPAPRGGVTVFATIDLLKAPILPEAV